MNKSESRIFTYTLIFSAIIVSLKAIMWVWQDAPQLLGFLGEQHISWMFAEELLSRNRAFYPFILPSILGGYLIMLLPLVIALHQKHYKNIDVPLFKRPIQNSLLLSLIILMFSPLLLTKSIGPIISLILSALIVLFLYKSSVKKPLTLLIYILGAILFMFILVRSYNVGYWRNPIFSLAQRQIYWANTWTVILRRPFLGTGPGNMPFVASQFSHNSYLQLWAESGAFALFGFLNITFYIFNKNLKRRLMSKPWDIWIWVSVLGFLIHNFIDFTFFLPEVAVIWWGILALFSKKEYT